MLFHFLFTLSFLGVYGGSTNYTIDDTNGDTRTGAIPIYEPGNGTIPYGEGWTENCEGCWVVPNSEEVFDGTWHHATDLHSGYTGLTASFGFTGTALYVYCIIPTYWGGANWFGTSNGSSTWTNMTFTLDGKPSGSYVYTPPMDNTDASSMDYNALVFAAEGLQNSDHQFVVEPVNGSIIMFDYAIYTYEDDISAPSQILTTGTTAKVTSSLSSTSTSISTSYSPSGIVSSEVISTFTVIGITTISSSGGSPTVSETIDVVTEKVTPTSMHVPTSTGIPPPDITSLGSGLATIVASLSSTGTPTPHVLSKSGMSWRLPVAASIGGAALIVVLLFLVIFLCRRRRSRLVRVTQANPQEGTGWLQENATQVRDGVLPIMTENTNVMVSSRTSLLPQRRQSVNPAVNSDIQSNSTGISQTELLRPRQSMTLAIPQLSPASSTSSSTEPTGPLGDVRSLQKNQVSSEKTGISRQDQDWEDRGTLASSGIFPPPTYTSIFRSNAAEEPPPMPSPYRRPRSLPVTGTVQT